MFLYFYVKTLKVNVWRGEFILTRRKNLYVLSLIVLALLILLAALNLYSFNYAKNACIDNSKTPIVERTFLAINWSVSCE